MGEPVRLDFDGDGDLITPPLPNFPVAAVAAPTAGGKYHITWEYDSYGQGGWPTDFQVFEGSTPETVDYNTPLTDSVTGETTVVYRGNQRIYRFTTQAYDHWSEHVFAVRGRNSNGTAEKNTYTTTTKRAVNATPASAAAPERVRVQPYGRLAG